MHYSPTPELKAVKADGSPFFVLAVAAGAAALVFKDASEEGSAGNDWPADVCSTSKLFCNHPEYAAYVAIASIVLAIGFKLIRKL